MTNIDKIKYQDVGNIYGERTWIEYGFRQSKSELGWSDFHVTKYNDITKWWSAICCAFLLVSMRAISTQPSELSDLSTCQSELNSYLAEHPDWDFNQGWKSMLNNMQLLLLPLLALKLVEPFDDLIERSRFYEEAIAFFFFCAFASLTKSFKAKSHSPELIARLKYTGAPSLCLLII